VVGEAKEVLWFKKKGRAYGRQTLSLLNFNNYFLTEKLKN
jgi:hypothetical protein